MNIEEIHNIELVPYEHEYYEPALKNFALFTHIHDVVVIALLERHMSIAFDYLAKQEFEYQVIFLDEPSFEKLYNEFIDLKADKEMSSIQQEQEDAILLDEDEFSVAEFLKVGTDILTSEESAPIIKFVNSLFYQAIKKMPQIFILNFMNLKVR